MTDDTQRPEAGPPREADAETTEEAVDESAAAGGTAGPEADVIAPEAPAAVQGEEPAPPAAASEETAVTGDTEAASVADADVTEAEEPIATVPAAESTAETAAKAAETNESVAEAETQPVTDEMADVANGAETVAVTAEAPTEVAEDVTVSEPGVDVPIGDQRSDTFVWHPDHRGKTVAQVRAALAQEIASDQRQHRLAMDGAEESEQDALASVVSLERKWGPYDFDWAEQDPDALAARITEFEQERERRREMLSWADYRNAQLERDEEHEAGGRPGELSTGTKAFSLLLVVLLIVVILLAVWAL